MRRASSSSGGPGPGRLGVSAVGVGERLQPGLQLMPALHRHRRVADGVAQQARRRPALALGREQVGEDGDRLQQRERPVDRQRQLEGVAHGLSCRGEDRPR
jgi:hypothetical protein